MSKWARLWKALVAWWRDTPPPPVKRSEFLPIASKALEQYDDLYCQRVKISPQLSGQAASAILNGDTKRAPCLESEVRVLAIVVERILRHLQVEEQQRFEQRADERLKYPTRTLRRSWHETRRSKPL